MASSENTAKLVAALAKAQAEYTKLGKDKTGREGNLSFKYVQLPDVLSMVRPLLNKYSVYLSQPLVKGEDGLLRQTTRVQLEDEWIQSDGVPIPALSPGKEMGKTITYARRIDLMPFLGISGEDEDEDAPDLKPGISTAYKPTFGKPVNTPIQVKTHTNVPNLYQEPVITNGTFEATDDDLPDFNSPLKVHENTLTPDARACAEEMENFKPLSETRNTEIQNRLRDLVAAKTVGRRDLALFLEVRHDNKKQFDVQAAQWEATLAEIEKAVSEGPTAVKKLLKSVKE